jgi:uroporphyrinogen-III synthase
LLTRPQAQARHLADELIAQGVQPNQIIIDPILKIAPIEAHCDISAGTGLIITSANALAYLPAALRGSQLPCYCVGYATSQTARALGLKAYHLADTAKALCEALTTSSHKGPLLHLRGTHTTLDMAKHFRSTSLRDEKLRQSSPVILPIFSARSARLLGKLALDWHRHWAVALSPAIAALCREAGFGQITTAAHPNRQAMMAVITPLMGVKSS